MRRRQTRLRETADEIAMKKTVRPREALTEENLRKVEDDPESLFNGDSVNSCIGCEYYTGECKCPPGGECHPE